MVSDFVEYSGDENVLFYEKKWVGLDIERSKLIIFVDDDIMILIFFFLEDKVEDGVFLGVGKRIRWDIVKNSCV